MGILTLTGIILGAVGTTSMAVGGVFLAIDVSQKGTQKFLETWKEEVNKAIKKKTKE